MSECTMSAESSHEHPDNGMRLLQPNGCSRAWTDAVQRHTELSLTERLPRQVPIQDGAIFEEGRRSYPSFRPLGRPPKGRP